ncbi:MAG TPA: LamB/YcsF family protein [Flavobacteriaceae bacterium]|nr:LamB/YcsF family protein [Flavobacteriaceae bacterium]
MVKTIDISCDLGEGIGNDQQLMPLISSCSIACGGHYGDETSIYEALLLAKKFNVKVGAHPSFPDKPNFGRVPLTMTSEALSETIVSQIKLFEIICKKLDMSMHHVKLHGALYNLAATDTAVAKAVIAALKNCKFKAALYVPPHSVIGKLAKSDVELIYEAFIDRRYNPNLTLVSRAHNKMAIITNPEDAWMQLKNMIFDQKVLTSNGSFQAIEATTFCLHGDHPQAVELLKYIHKQLQINSITLS